MTFRRCLLVRSASRLALVAACAMASPDAVRAQSFQGSGAVVAGSASIDQSVTGHTTVTVSSSSAVIDWTPLDIGPGPQPILFQPGGTTAVFAASGSTPDFSVLNRILPADPGRAITLDGTVLSTLASQAGQAVTGGRVYFYSPAGIIVGPSALIDVGSLGLTTAMPVLDGTGDFLAGNSLDLAPAAPGSSIKIRPGARITTNGASHFLAFAPEVANAGVIEAGQVAALVSADAGQVTFGLDGLVTIQISSGTSASGSTLVQDGVIRGSASSSASQLNRIYLVSIARNDAINMALGAGAVTGFTPASSASMDGNAIVLSGGHDIIGGQIAATLSPGSGTGQVDLVGRDFATTSSLTAQVSGRAEIGSIAQTGLELGGNTAIIARQGADLSAEGSGRVWVSGNLALETRADMAGAAGSGPLPQTRLSALSGGQIFVQGDLDIASVAHGASSGGTGTRAGDAHAGDATLLAGDGASIGVLGDVSITSLAYGGFGMSETSLAGNSLALFAPGPENGIAGGNALAGNAQILANGPASSNLTISGNLAIRSLAYGAGGTGCVSCGADGGSGQAAKAAIQLSGAAHAVSVGGSSVLEASGFGGAGLGGAGGSGQGGIAHLYLHDEAGATLGIEGETSLRSAGRGGDHLAGGQAGIGSADMALVQIEPGVAGGRITLGSSLVLETLAEGGGASAPGGIGGLANITRGSLVTLNSGALEISGHLGLDASSQGGFGAQRGGDATGARGHLDASSGSQVLVAGDLAILASSQGGNADIDSLASTGGTGSSVSARAILGIRPEAPGAVAPASPVPASDLPGVIIIDGMARLEARGFGGSGQQGGEGSGGVAELAARWGTIEVGASEPGAVILDASGQGGNGAAGGAGGRGLGGMASMVAASSEAGKGVLRVGETLLLADGAGGSGGAGSLAAQAGGSGGAGLGGTAEIYATSGNGMVIAGDVLASASGSGGAGGDGSALEPGGIGGAGAGGQVRAGMLGVPSPAGQETGSARFAAFSGDATGRGGPGGQSLAATGGAGGPGQGGKVQFLALRAPVAIADGASLPGAIGLFADAIGGDGGAGQAAGAGGMATAGGQGGIAVRAGYAALSATPALQSVILEAASMSGSASAIGGGGATPGLAQVGASPLQVDIRNADVRLGDLHLVSHGSDAMALASQDPAFVSLDKAMLDVSGDLVIETSGSLLLRLDEATIRTAGLDLSAANFLPLATFSGTLPGGAASLLASAPATPGTLVVVHEPGRPVTISSGQDFRTFANIDIDVSGNIEVPGEIEFGDYSRPSGLLLAGGSIRLGAITGDDMTLSATGEVTTGSVSVTGQMTVFAGGGITTGAITASQGMTLHGQSAIAAGDLSSSGSIDLRAGTSLMIGSAAGSDLLALAGTGISTGGLSLGGSGILARQAPVALSLAVGPSEPLAAPTAPGIPQGLARVAGPIALAGPVTAGSIAVLSQGPVTAGAMVAAGDLVIDSLAGVQTGALQAGRALLEAGGSLLAGDVSVVGELRARSGGSMTMGVVGAGAAAILGAGQDLFIDDIGSPADLMLMAAGSADLGQVSAGADSLPGASQGGTILVGHVDMLDAAGGLASLSPAALTDAVPQPVGGTVTLRTSATANRIVLAASGDVLASDISAGEVLRVESGATATVSGRWAASAIELSSHDIEIPASGTAGAAGLEGDRVLLQSRNSIQAAVGDPAATDETAFQSGAWRLSGSEFSRIRAKSLALVASDNPGPEADLVIGNLAVSGTALPDPAGSVTFATGSLGAPSGVLRISGAIEANGFAQQQALRFVGGVFELSASRGSIAIADGAGAAGGGIVVSASRIHVADDALLVRLREEGYQAIVPEDLNRPSATARPQGVLRARSLLLEPQETLYIQNTGTAAVPAGFLAGIDTIDVVTPAGGGDGLLRVIINGAFLVDGKVVTGETAANLLLSSATGDFAGYTPDSQLNGCLFSLDVCISRKGEVPSLASQVVALAQAPVETAPAAGDEEVPGQEAPGQEEAQAASPAAPIPPPASLVNVASPASPAVSDMPVSGRGKSLLPMRQDAGANREEQP